MTFGMICLQLLEGLGSSTLIFLLTLVFSLPLGLFVCFGRMSTWAPFRRLDPDWRTRAIAGVSPAPGFKGWLSRVKPVRAIFVFFIAILRGTPLMLQLLVVCYGPYYLFGARISTTWRFAAIIVGFVINYAAYFAEIYRSGIESIPPGQWEAAEVLGYTHNQTFYQIILPQMIKRVLPPVTNEVITLVKDTSLAFVLAYAEMFTVAKQIAAAETSFAPLFVAGLFYFIFNAVVAWAMEKVEKSFSYYT